MARFLIMPINFMRSLRHISYPLHMAPVLPWILLPCYIVLNNGTYNIRYRSGFWIPQEIWATQLVKYSLVVLRETYIPDEVYCNNGPGYVVACSGEVPTAVGCMQGGVVLVTRERPEFWDIESTWLRGSNVVSCEVVSGSHWIPLIGAYPPPCSPRTSYRT